MTSNQLFYMGIVLMASAMIIGVVAFMTLRISKEKLKKQLDKEYGKERH